MSEIKERVRRQDAALTSALSDGERTELMRLLGQILGDAPPAF